MDRIVLKDESYAVVGACIAVHEEKGSGFLEAVYQECLGLEFRARSIPFVEQPHLELEYRGQRLSQVYQPDFVCFNKLIVELKAISATGAEHRAQVLNYLKATGFELGLLVNFGRYPTVQVERVVNTRRPRFEVNLDSEPKNA